MLHVFCGDVAADNLINSSLKGKIMVWCDPISEGPTPAGLSPSNWFQKRAKYIQKASFGNYDYESVLSRLKQQDRDLKRYTSHEETVLWFDACMYDQIILSHHLHFFKTQEVDLKSTPITLVCVGEVEGMKNYQGLGQLDSKQLKNYFPQRRSIMNRDLERGKRVWDAYCSKTPLKVERVLKEDFSGLEYLKEALIRHLEKFPSVQNGLGRLDQEILESIQEGNRSLMQIFKRASEKEDRPFFGDSTFLYNLYQLINCENPLIELTDDFQSAVKEPLDLNLAGDAHLTSLGSDILADRKDNIEFNGIDRWYGGVHLTGKHPEYRWNKYKYKLVKRP